MRIRPVTINEQFEYKRIIKRRWFKAGVIFAVLFVGYFVGHIIYALLR